MTTAFITGATAGIGAATARHLVVAGWQVIVTGRRVDRRGRTAGQASRGRVRAAVLQQEVQEPTQLLVLDGVEDLPACPARGDEIRLNEPRQMERQRVRRHAHALADLAGG